MNEEAREWVEARRDRFLRHALSTQEAKHFMELWDAARTFSAEDVERVTAAIEKRQWGEYPFSTAFSSDLARVALAAIGTVEEAQ